MAGTRNILIFIIFIKCVNSSENYVSASDNSIYHNEFAVHVPSGSKSADIIAAKYDYENAGQIGSLENFFLFRQKRLQKRSTNPSLQHYDELLKDPQVTWVEQQVEKRRVKRDFDVLDSHEITDLHNLKNDDNEDPLNRVRRQFFPSSFPSNFGGFSFFKPAVRVQPIRRGTRFSDPHFSHQWYLSEGAVGGYDMNVSAAWANGFTGKGVVISILDDGIQHNHPDLAQNYDPLASTDINDNDADPMPRDNGDNKHGTRCAGEVASVAFNDYCGVGIAYNASVGGVRMLDGTVNDAVEARAISLNPDHIDIYSASWGPEDDGKTVDGPGPLAKRAFINGVIRGRHGKGSIFVWASGNGGRHTDNCNCDGYTNSIFTLSISSASQRGLKPWYLEECSSTLASTYSSGTPGLDLSVATADMDGSLRPDRICTLDHTGTSASAPLAAGLCALALEANPDLTWRDMQHIVVRTSRREPLMQEEGWFRNAVGRFVSHKFGYGLMDAGAMVNLARRWRSVPPQHVCQTIINRTDLTIPTIRGSSVKAQITTDGCAGTSGEVRYLEHVQAIVSLRFLPRGNINIKLISPSGTTSTLLFERPRDVLSEKFDDWPFLSVHFWGEKAAGTWVLVVTNGGSRQSSHPGVLVHWQLILHGTHQNPEKQLFSQSSFTSLTPSFTQFGDLRFSGSMVHQTIEPFYQNLSTVALRSEFERKNVDSSVCHSECFGGCSGAGPQNCKACKRFSLDGECLSNCPDGTYGSENKICLPCHGSCAQCIGPRQNHCSTCSSQSLYVEHLGICVEMCPSGYYADNGLCLPCGTQCAKCQTAEYCLSCAHNLILFNGSCHASCREGMFEGNNNTCDVCESSCETCVQKNNCASCHHPFFLAWGRCISSCPDGTYGDKNSRLCRTCPLGCSSCSNDQCTSCDEGWRLKSGICVALRPIKCKINEFLSKNKCSSCHHSCLNCIGPNSTECLYCKSPSLLLNNQCVNSCPKGYYSHKSRCLSCPHGCSSCDLFEKCTLCDIKYHLYNSKCLPSCPDGFYSDRGICMKCELTCESCWGPQKDQCLSCPLGALRLHSTCTYSCPDGYFLDNFTCHPCYRNCKTCNESGIYSCTSCHPYFTLDGGMCLECRAGKYYNASEETCSDCHESCLTCSENTANSCTSCQPPYSLHLETKSCRICCQQSTKKEEDNSCCVCSSDTGECVGSGTTDKRRIANSLRFQEKVPPPSTISTIFLVVSICLGNFVLFSLVFIIFQSKLGSCRRNFNSYTYQPLPTETVSSKRSSSYPYPMAMATIPVADYETEEEEEEDQEYRSLFTRT